MTSNAALMGTILKTGLSAAGLDAREWLDSGWLTAGGIGLNLEQKLIQLQDSAGTAHRRLTIN